MNNTNYRSNEIVREKNTYGYTLKSLILSLMNS